MSRSLIALPDDGAVPILKAIHGAAQSLRIKLFSLSDEMILKALSEARQRGVKIRVMLNPARRSGEIQNRGAISALRSADIDILDTNPAFEVSHEKSMVVDDREAIIGSLNWDPVNFEHTRDFAVITRDPKEVAEVVAGFDADWCRTPFTPPKSSQLIWCPINGRERISEFIDRAQRTLYVVNERYQDAVIVEHLVRAKLRGVKVHVLTRPSHSLRPEKLVEGVGELRIMHDVGIPIHRIKHLKLHAKVLVADHSRAIVGSINLAPGSFEKRRELAITVRQKDVVHRLWKLVHRDWEQSHKIDLSDKGILQDLEAHPKLSGSARASELTASKTD